MHRMLKLFAVLLVALASASSVDARSLKGSTQAAYSQAMGATDSNGYVVSFPLDTSDTSASGAKQIWIDPVNGLDSYNGYSPCPGKILNGVGSDPFKQYGATACGGTNGAYGPKKTYLAGYQLVAEVGAARVGNQLFLAEGGTFYEGANFLGFIDDGSGGGSPSGVAGNILTVTTLQQGVIWTNQSVSESTSSASILTPGTGGTTGTGGVGTYQVFGSAQVTAPKQLYTIYTSNLGLRSGKSVAYPYAIQSYDPTDALTTGASALNLARQGRAGVGGVGTRPRLAASPINNNGNYGTIISQRTDNPLPTGSTSPRGNYAIRGIAFDSGTFSGDAGGLGWSTNWNSNSYNVLFENNTYPGTSFGFGSSNHAYQPRNIIFRRSSQWGNYSLVGATGGFGSSYANELVLEDVVIYHPSWPIGADRQLSTFTGSASGTTLTVNTLLSGTIAIGQNVLAGNLNSTITSGSGSSWQFSPAVGTIGLQNMMTTNSTLPDIFKQGVYASYGATDQNLIRRVVMSDPSASCLSGRGSIRAYHNVWIDCPIAMLAGGGVATTSSFVTESPTGVNNNYFNNLIMGGADINFLSPLSGQGIAMVNGRKGSSAVGNLLINNPLYSGGNSYVLNSSVGQNVPNWVEWRNNVACNFSATFDDYNPAAPFQSQLNSPAVAGTNGNTNSVSCPGGITNNQIYTAVCVAVGQSCTDKDGMMAYAVTRPDINWAQIILGVTGQLFNFNFALGG